MVRTEIVQSLWSGYGEIVRVTLRAAKEPSVVVKWVDPPTTASHPRGWSGAAGHARKLRSYQVEECFYTGWLPAPERGHRTARCWFAGALADGSHRFVLEDLDAAGFRERSDLSITPAQLRACLAWLANFHARFLGREPEGLWPVGTYWHLATRQDELGAMKDPDLRAAAEPLDELLNGCRFRTLVHGDAKVANFCFGADGVAAVDFQYVGGGAGIKDVAYLLSSCLSDAECEAQAERWLAVYFAALRAALGREVDADAVEAEWRGLYPAAWADFHRFLDGWAVDHWKIHSYTRRMTQEALAAWPSR